jgi:hypothetical protein
MVIWGRFTRNYSYPSALRRAFAARNYLEELIGADGCGDHATDRQDERKHDTGPKETVKPTAQKKTQPDGHRTGDAELSDNAERFPGPEARHSCAAPWSDRRAEYTSAQI